MKADVWILPLAKLEKKNQYDYTMTYILCICGNRWNAPHLAGAQSEKYSKLSNYKDFILTFPWMAWKPVWTFLKSSHILNVKKMWLSTIRVLSLMILLLSKWKMQHNPPNSYGGSISRNSPWPFIFRWLLDASDHKWFKSWEAVSSFAYFANCSHLLFWW